MLLFPPPFPLSTPTPTHVFSSVPKSKLLESPNQWALLLRGLWCNHSPVTVLHKEHYFSMQSLCCFHTLTISLTVVGKIIFALALGSANGATWWWLTEDDVVAVDSAMCGLWKPFFFFFFAGTLDAIFEMVFWKKKIKLANRWNWSGSASSTVSGRLHTVQSVFKLWPDRIPGRFPVQPVWSVGPVRFSELCFLVMVDTYKN